MTKPLYRTLLRDAWQTTWTHKRLWVWGLFAALLGNAGEYQFLLTAGDRVGSGSVFAEETTVGAAILPTFTILKGFGKALMVDPFAVVSLFAVALVIIAVVGFFIWLTMVSIIALTHGAAVAAGGDEAPALSEGVDTGRKFFGPVLVLYVLGRLVQWFLLALLVLFGTLTVLDGWIGWPMFFVAFIVFVPALFAISFVVRYAIFYVVLGGKSMMDALEGAATLLRKHWLITIEMALALLLINIIAAIALIAALAIIIFPLFLAALTLVSLQFTVWPLVVGGIAIILFIALLFATGAFLGTFQWVAWTNLFLKFRVRGHVSKIVRVLGRILPDRPLRFGRRA